MKWIKEKLKKSWKWFVGLFTIGVALASTINPVILTTSFDHNGKTINIEYTDGNIHPDYDILGEAENSGMKYRFSIGNKTKTEACDIPEFPGVSVKRIIEQIKDIEKQETVIDYIDGEPIWNELLQATTTPKIKNGSHQNTYYKDEWKEVEEVCVEAESVKLLEVEFDEPFNGLKGERKKFNIEWNGSILDPWFSPAYTYCQPITINNSQVGTTTTAFPVLATTTDANLATTGNGGNVENDNGYDIIFTDGTDCNDDSGSLLDFERELYASTTGQIVFHIESPVDSGTDETILMYFGNSGASDQATTTGVWDCYIDGSVCDWGGTYNAVWHMAEDPSIDTDGECGGGTDETCDSTLKANHGDSAGSMTSGDLVSGQIGNGIDFDGFDDFIDFGNDASIKAPYLSVETWFQIDNNTDLGSLIDARDDHNSVDGYTLIMINPNLRALADGMIWTVGWIFSNGAIPNLTWTHVVLLLENGKQELYINGVKQTSTDTQAGPINYDDIAPVRIGGGNDGADLNGIMDETRISTFLKTAGWVTTSYNNQSDVGTFLTFERIEQNKITTTDWTYQKKFTINKDEVDYDGYFPVLATTTDANLKSTGNGGNVEFDNCEDCLFVDSDGETVLDFELEFYASTTGEIIAFVRTEVSSTTDKDIYLLYGNSDNPISRSIPENVWDSDFEGVYHFQNDGTGDEDSTLNGNDLTFEGNTTTVDAGYIDGEIQFDGTGDYAENGDVDLPLFTISTIVTSQNITDDMLLIWKANSYGLGYGTPIVGGNSGEIHASVWDGGDFLSANSGVSLTDGVPLCIHGTYDGTDIGIYTDGVERGTQAQDAPVDTADPLTLSWNTTSFDYDGFLDEVRISSVKRPDGWISTDCNSMMSVGTFMDIGEQEETAVEAPAIIQADIILFGEN